ncbi:MAG: LysM peptidoglycan-binding domain-containing protein [Verrucomicrobiia bacterium]
MKVSKVVLVVAALHVLVIGGIFVFEGCSRSQSKVPDMAMDESQPGAKPTDVGAPTNAVAAQELTSPAPVTPAPAIAASVPAAKVYVVKKGDSLWKIAKAEGASQAEIVKANNLSKNSTLKAGQKLQIPQVAKATPTATVAAATIPSSADVLNATAATDASEIYVVKSGDSLWKIAQTHRVSVSAIKHANNLAAGSLKVGQKLKMPAVVASNTPAAGEFREPGTYTENNQTVHYVESGESPVVIAKKYGVKVDELMKINNITDPRRVQYGQRLVIPAAVSPATSTARVTSTTAPMPMASAAHTTSSEPSLAAPVVTTGPAMIH